MEDIFVFIVVALACVGVLAIIMKIANKFIYVNLIILLASAVTLVIVSFVAKVDAKGEIDFSTIAFQFVALFCFLLFLQSCIAFDTSNHYSTRVTYYDDDRADAVTTVTEKSNFWPVLGCSLGFSAVPIALIYWIFGSDEKPLRPCHIIGWIGVVCAVIFGIFLTRFIIQDIKARRRY